MALELSNEERQSAEWLVERALAEDLAGPGDLTSRALIPEDMQGGLRVVSRVEGVLAGAPIARMVYERLDRAVTWESALEDGSRLVAGSVVATLAGPMRSLLSGERTALNFLIHLSGIASFTRRFVDAVAGTKAAILDTRKTLPGWRQLAKYAVRAGGGTNHRMGLFDGCLIKDNHLAAWLARNPGATIADAVGKARAEIEPGVPIEVEVDSVEQLVLALAGNPDMVLLDNMDVPTLRECVELRNRLAPGVLLEVSGRVNLSNVATIAATGVERISIGALTHSAPALDLAFDWP